MASIDELLARYNEPKPESENVSGDINTLLEKYKDVEEPKPVEQVDVNTLLEKYKEPETTPRTITPEQQRVMDLTGVAQRPVKILPNVPQPNMPVGGVPSAGEPPLAGQTSPAMPQAPSEKPSITGAMARSAISSLVPAGGGVAGFEVGMRAPVPGLWKVATGLAGMFAGQYLASKAQGGILEAALGTPKYQQLQQKISEDIEARPVASMIGQTVPLLAVQGISVQNAKNAYNAAKLISKMSSDSARKWIALHPKEMQDLANVAFGTGTSLGLEAITQIREGKLDLGRLAASTVIGVFMNKNTKFGDWLKGKFKPEVLPVVTEPSVTTRAAELATTEKPVTAVEAKPITVYRGDVVNREVSGTGKNITGINKLEDIAVGFSPEHQKPRFLKRLARLKRDAKKAAEEYNQARTSTDAFVQKVIGSEITSRSQLARKNAEMAKKDYRNLMQTYEDVISKPLRSKKEYDSLVQRNQDVLFLTTDEKIAEGYARQGESLPDILRVNIPDRNPVITTMEMTLNNPKDLRSYSTDGYIEYSDYLRMMKQEFGINKAVADKIYGQTNAEDNLNLYQLFRGEALESMKPYFRSKGIDGIRFMEGESDQFAVLDRSKVKEISRNYLLQPSPETSAKVEQTAGPIPAGQKPVEAGAISEKQKPRELTPAETPTPPPLERPKTVTEAARRNLALPTAPKEVRQAFKEQDVIQGKPDTKPNAVLDAQAKQYVEDRGGIQSIIDEMLATGKAPEGDVGVTVSKRLLFASPEYIRMLKRGDPAVIKLHDIYREQGSEQGRAFKARVDDMESPAERRGLLSREVAGEATPEVDLPPTKQSKKDALLAWADKIEADAKRMSRITLGSGPGAAIEQYTLIGAAKIVRGAVKFADWAKIMVDEFGPSIRPHLNKLWVKAQALIKKQQVSPEIERAAKAIDQNTKIQKILKTLDEQGYDIEKLTDADLMDDNKFADILNILSTSKATPMDKVSEFWRNAILSGLKTHVVNTTANVAHVMYDWTLQRWVETGLGALSGNKNAPTAKSIMAMYRAIGPSFADAKSNFINAWTRERTSNFMDSPGKLDIGRGPAIKGEKGEIIRAPQRFLVAADEFAKTVIRQATVADYARREARKKNLPESQIEDFIASEIGNPDSASNKFAETEAKRLTFQEEPGAVANALMQLRNGDSIIGHTFKFLFPFIKTPASILRTTIRKSPLGVANLIAEPFLAQKYKKYTGDAGQQKFYRDAAEQLIGLTTLAAISAYVKPDDKGMPRITGSRSGSGSAGEREFYKQNIPPQSIRIGDNWYSYSRLDPFSGVLSLMVDMMNASGARHDQIGNVIFNSIKNNIKDKSYLKTVGDMFDAFENASTFSNISNRIAQSVLTGFVPQIIKDPLRSLDKYYRDNRLRKDDQNVIMRWLKNTGQQAIPDGVFAPIQKYDIWGKPVERVSPVENNLGDLAFRMLAPVRVQKANSMNNIDRMLWNYNRTQDDPEKRYWPAPVALTIKDKKGNEIILNEQAFAAYQRRRGELAWGMLEKRGGFNFESPKDSDIKAVKHAFERANEIADREFYSIVNKR